MHNRTKLTVLAIGLCGLLAASGCSGGKDTASVPTESETDTPPTTVPDPVTNTEYDGSQYIIEEFWGYSDSDDGIDLDGDGVNDNATPDALVLVDAFVKYDMTVEGLNGTIAGAIAEDQLLLLMETTYDDVDLTLDILTGMLAGSGVPAVDPISYDKAGDPLSSVEGYFTSDTDFYGTADRVQVGVTFFPKEPALPLPIEMVTVVGTADQDTISGSLYGAIPADDLMELLIIPLLEDSIVDPGERKTMIGLVEGVLDYPTVTDIDLGDGRRGISCAFYFEGVDILW